MGATAAAWAGSAGVFRSGGVIEMQGQRCVAAAAAIHSMSATTLIHSLTRGMQNVRGPRAKPHGHWRRQTAPPKVQFELRACRPFTTTLAFGYDCAMASRRTSYATAHLHPRCRSEW